MNNEPLPQNPAGPMEQSGQFAVERQQNRQYGAQEQYAVPEQAPRVEAAPVPGASPAPQAPMPTAPPMTRDDAAAAVAAMPGGVPAAGPVAGMPPDMAGDVDVIEPEWVAAAEQVVAQHEGDPYGEEQAVEQLQRDYLKKRYNYDVADPDSQNSAGGAMGS